MSVVKSKWILKDSQSLETSIIDGSLQVNLDAAGAMERTANGLNIKTSGITNGMLAGSIEESKLANTFIRADGANQFTADQSMNGFRLLNLGTPTSGTDAATKTYVDNAITGLTWLPPVEYNIEYVKTTTGAPTGSGAVGEECLNTADNTLYVHDGSSWGTSNALSSGDRFLFGPEDGTDSSGDNGSNIHDNKIYEFDGTSVNSSTPVAGSALFSKPDDMAFVYDDDTSEWIQFTGTGQIVAGSGLVKSDNVLNVGAGTAITVNADDIAVDVSALAGDGLEVSANTLRISAAAAGNGLTGGAGSPLAVNTGDGLTISSDQVVVVATDLAGTGLDVDANNLRISAAAAGNGLVGGAGSPLAVGAGSGINVTSDAVELGSLTANWDLGGSFTITNVPTPVNSSDVANKSYVDSQVGGVNNRQVEYFTLTSTDITNKYVTLGNTPTVANSVIMTVKGAPSQYYGDDYQMDGTNTDRLTWDSLSLDGILEAGDKLAVVYQI